MPEPKRCSCCEKHTLRAEEEKKKLLNRLRRIEGQVRGLQAMVALPVVVVLSAYVQLCVWGLLSFNSPSSNATVELLSSAMK